MPGVDLKKAKEKLLKSRQEAEARKAMGDSYKWEIGKRKIRVLPPWDDSGEWHVEAFWHYNVAKFPLLCPKRNFNEQCPICELVDDLLASGDKENAKNYRVNLRCHANFLDLNQEQDEELLKPRIASFPPSLRDDLLLLFDEEDGFGDYTDPTSGRNVTIEVTGEKMQRKYSVMPAPKASAIPQFAEKVKPNIKDLKKHISSQKRSYEELAKILESGGTDSQDPTDKADTDSAPTAATESEAVDVEAKFREKLAKLKAQKDK